MSKRLLIASASINIFLMLTGGNYVQLFTLFKLLRKFKIKAKTNKKEVTVCIGSYIFIV